MRKGLSRGRGRPRGRYLSARAGFRLLEYLARLSIKYDIDSKKFLNSFVDAWNHQRSQCKNLLIECRGETRDSVVFLITHNSEVVAQFSMPKRFGLKFTNEQGGDSQPVMVHRAILGSLERFIGILIEHTGGDFPVWLAPVQVRVIPINDELTTKQIGTLLSSASRILKPSFSFR